jgi:hypothetical protein
MRPHDTNNRLQQAPPALTLIARLLAREAARELAQEPPGAADETRINASGRASDDR